MKGGVAVAAILVAVVVLVSSGVEGQSLYACWGGCYNKCFIGNVKATDSDQKLSCEYQCLNTCIPRTTSDFLSYCKLGCSLKRCLPLSSSADGAKLEKCYGWCGDLCKKYIV